MEYIITTLKGFLFGVFLCLTIYFILMLIEDLYEVIKQKIEIKYPRLYAMTRSIAAITITIFSLSFILWLVIWFSYNLGKIF